MEPAERPAFGIVLQKAGEAQHRFLGSKEELFVIKEKWRIFWYFLTSQIGSYESSLNFDPGIFYFIKRENNSFPPKTIVKADFCFENPKYLVAESSIEHLFVYSCGANVHPMERARYVLGHRRSFLGKLLDLVCPGMCWLT